MNNWANLRESFAALVAQLNPQLGQIAVDIACALDKPNEGQTGFLSPKKEFWKQPANFLANGDATNPKPVFWATSVDESDFYYDNKRGCWKDQRKTGEALTNLLRELAVWKDPQNASELGFNVEAKTPPGLALLFDPLVDFALASHLLCDGFTKPLRILVLTDYYPLVWNGLDLIRALKNSEAKQDWAVENTLALNNVSPWSNFKLDQTSYWLARCFQPDKLSDPARQLFVENRLLLWNFFPFFRGGFGKTSGDGLPSWGASYRAKCLEWLFAFVQAVDATEVIVASNNVVFPDRNGGKATDQLELLEHLKVPETYKGIESLLQRLVEKPKEISPNLEKVYRVPHPLHWRSKELRECLRKKFCEHTASEGP
jgi:hypothetical protein